VHLYEGDFKGAVAAAERALREGGAEGQARARPDCCARSTAAPGRCAGPARPGAGAAPRGGGGR
jgi:hypothetical protein